MVRYAFVVPVLGWMILGGCGSSDVQPTLSTAVQLSTTVTDGPTCDGLPDVGRSVAHPVGQPVVVAMKNENVTQSCRCQYTNSPQWGCGGQQCESQYDLGAENPQKCDRVDAVPEPLGGVHARVDRADCSAVVIVKDSSHSSVEVTCTTTGPASVAISVAGMPGQITRLAMFFTDDGRCPAGDAGVEAGVDAGVDAGAAAEADAGAEVDDAGAEAEADADAGAEAGAR